MPRRLLAVNVLLAGVSVLCIALIVKQLAAVGPTAAPRGRPPVAPPAAPASAAEARLPGQAYSVIATRNLFSPTRTEMAGAGVVGSAPALIVKPSLHGVVLRDGSPIAYLEDPLTKRIAGYRIGDPIAGGTVQTISADAVVIARPDGMVDVRLRDPSKPRPQPTAAPPQPGVPSQQPVPGAVAPPPVPGPQPTGGGPVVPPRAFAPPTTQPVPGVLPQPNPAFP